MATKVQMENYFPGDYSMRDLSRETNGSGWPPCYSDMNLPNGQFYYGFSPRTISDVHPGYDKDVVKQTMLKHEVVFKDQVYELHRLYRVQRDLMDEVRRKEQFKRCTPYEASSSSGPLPSQKQLEDAQRWNDSNFALASPVSGRPLISGADTVNSSPNSVKGKSVLVGPNVYQNCYSPKNSEVSESRPTKFRKQMLDLQLPADEYIDTDNVEEFGRKKGFEKMISSTEKTRQTASENGKMFLGSDLHISKPKPLADLNEPFHVEEMTTFSSVNVLDCSVNQGDVSYRDHHTRFLSSSKDIPENSKKSSMNGFNNIRDTRAIGQDWFWYASESEHCKPGLRTTNHGIQPEKVPVPSQPVHSMLDQACHPPAFLTSDHINVQPWKAKSDRVYSLSSYSIAEPSQPGLLHPSDLGKSWDQSATSWAKPNIFSSTPASIQTSQFLSAVNLSKNPQLSAQSNDFNKWNLNNNPEVNAAFANDPPLRNGFYQGSSSELKELPAYFSPSSFDHGKYNSEITAHGHGKNSIKTNGCFNVNPVKEMNLNVALSNGVSRRLEIIDGNCIAKDPLAVLPWLRGKSVCNNDVTSNSCEVDTKARKCESGRKILGVPIFDNPPLPKKENTAVNNPLDINHCSGREEIESGKRKHFFDINVPCEPIDEVVVVDKREAESGSLRNSFDLNSCIMEEEIPCETSKVSTGIDLESPASPENEDIVLPVVDYGDAELIKSAAASIVAISSCVVNSTQVTVEVATCPLLETVEGDDPLNWFVSIACSSGTNPEIPTVQDDGLPEAIDDFEYMILRLKECSPEDYFPSSSIPDFSFIENGTCALTSRTRRGPGRRAKQKRDFQRDILPGLTTLSRHDVTEDLQTFGGLMRATGYAWHSAPNRTRNRCGRGRQKSVVETPLLSNTVCALPLKPLQQEVHSNNMEVSLEDRSLTGWGKTTRRPRRQRCPAGNPSLPMPLT